MSDKPNLVMIVSFTEEEHPFGWIFNSVKKSPCDRRDPKKANEKRKLDECRTRSPSHPSLILSNGRQTIADRQGRNRRRRIEGTSYRPKINFLFIYRYVLSVKRSHGALEVPSFPTLKFKKKSNFWLSLRRRN